MRAGGREERSHCMRVGEKRGQEVTLHACGWERREVTHCMRVGEKRGQEVTHCMRVGEKRGQEVTHCMRVGEKRGQEVTLHVGGREAVRMVCLPPPPPPSPKLTMKSKTSASLSLATDNPLAFNLSWIIPSSNGYTIE